MSDFNDFASSIKSSSQWVENHSKIFMDKHEDRLNIKFDTANNFQTSVRGLKIRGTFSTQ